MPRQVQDKHTESQTKRREKRFRAQVYLSAGQAAHVLHAVADHPGQVRQRLRCCCCCSEASHRHRRRVGRHRLGVNCCRNSVQDQPCAKWSPSCFECFPYVCPEPVLVKKIVLYINGAKQVKKTLNAIAQKHALSVLRRNCLGLPWPRVKRQES